MVLACRVFTARAVCLLGHAMGPIVLAGSALAVPRPADITTDTTWTLAGSPYTFSGSALNIINGATLTIEPGVEVRMGSGQAIVVGSDSQAGALWAVGTLLQPITFKRTGSARWANIHFKPNTIDSSSRLQHCLLDWGGATGTQGGAVYCQDASPSFADITIHQSKINAIHLVDSSPTFSGIIHQTGGASTGGGLLGGASSFSGGAGGPGQFGATEWLIYASSTNSAPTFVAPHLFSQGKFLRMGARAWANCFNASPTIQGSGYIGEVLPGNLTISSTWGLPAISALHLMGSLTIAGDAQSTEWPVLTIAPGAVLQLAAGAAIEVGATSGVFRGGLLVSGTAASPVLIEGQLIGGLPAAWAHVRYGVNALAGQSRLEHVTLRGGGNSTALEPASLVIEGGAPAIDNVRVQDSSTSGVLVSNSAPTVTDLTIDGFGSSRTGLYCRNFSTPSSVAVQMSGTNLIDGRGLGSTGVAFLSSEPQLGGLTIAGVTGRALDGAVTGGAVAPTFANVTIAANVGALGRGSPDLWANFFNSNPTLLGSGWIQEVTTGQLKQSTTWGGYAALASIHLQNDLSIGGTESPMLSLAAATLVRLDAPRSILVGIGTTEPGGLRILGTEASPVVLEPSGTGRWGRIRFNSSSRADSTIEHCEMRRGGGTADPAALDVSGVSLQLSDIELTDCWRGAILLSNSSSALSSISIDGFDAINGPVVLYPAISISNGDDVTLTGSNVIRGGPGTGRRGISISPSSNSLKGPQLSGLDLDELAERAFLLPFDAPAPVFESITVGADVGDVGIGGPDFWAALLQSGPTILGTGYIQQVYGGTLTRSTTWGSGPGQTFSAIHLLGGLTINGPSPVLTLLPGSTVRVATGSSINVDASLFSDNGALVAVGTPAQHIVFDSITPGQRWRAINLDYQAALAGTRLEYCDFYNGGSTTPATISSFKSAGVLPTLRNLSFIQDSGTAIRLTDSTADGWINSVSVYGCDVGVEVDLSGGSLMITNSTFDSLNTAGVLVSGTATSSLNLVESCTFTDTKQALLHPSGGAALVLHQCNISDWGQGDMNMPAVQFAAGSYPAIVGSSFTGGGVVARIPASAAELLCSPMLANTFTLGAGSRVDLWGDSIQSPTCWSDAVGVPFRVLGNVTYAAPLTIEAGVEIQFAQASTLLQPLSPEQPLRVLGTSTNPVVLSPVGASWGGLVGGPGTVIEHAFIDRAGQVSTQALELRGAGTLRNSTISGSLGYGLRQALPTGGPAMTVPTWLVECTFSSNAKGGVRLPTLALVEARGCTFAGNQGEGAISSAGSSVAPAKMGLRECTFTGNVPGAILFTTQATADVVDARFCWWGHPDGPIGGGQAISGPGDALFDPWYGTSLGAFRITDADIDPTTFDPVESSVTWAGDLTAVGSWNLDVKNSVDETVFDVAGSGSVDVEWDGVNEFTSTPSPDGDYSFVLTADETGGAMAQSILKGTITLASSALIAEIDSPDELAFIAGGASLPIVGTAAGTQIADFVLEYGYGNNPKTYFAVPSLPDPPIVGGSLGSISVPLSQPQGILTVRVKALNSTGGSLAATRPYKLHSIVTSPTLPASFSPDADGFQDESELSASMAWASDWTVEIFQGATGPIRSWSGTGSEISLAWDGKNASGVVQPEGTYTFEIEAEALDSTTVATASVPVEIDIDAKAIEITAPTGTQPLQAMVDVTLAIGETGNTDYHWRVEHGPLPTWSLIASGTGAPTPIDWNTTLAPSGPRTLRASLVLANGTAHEDEVDVTIANPDVTLSNRVLDPLAGESTSIGLNHGGVLLDGNVVFSVKSASVTTNTNWVGKLESIGSAVWTSPPLPLVGGMANVLWDGTIAPGVPVAAGDYVVEALVAYAGGGTAMYSEDPSVIYPVDNTFLVNTSVGSGFDPYFGERVAISFGLLEPAWVTLSYNSALVVNNPPIHEVHGMLKNVLHDGGPTHPGHVFEWDGRAVDRDGLAAGDGDGEPVEFYAIGVRMVRAPRSLMTVTNRRTLIEQPLVSPVAIQPLHGQVAKLTFTLPYDARVSVRLVDTVNSGLMNSTGALFRTLMSEASLPAGPIELTIDGTDDEDRIPVHFGTYAIVIEVKDEDFPSFTSTRRLCLRIFE